MKGQLFVIVVIVAVVGTQGSFFQTNAEKELKKQEQFKQAAQANDRETLTKLFQTLVDTLKKAHDNTNKFFSHIHRTTTQLDEPGFLERKVALDFVRVLLDEVRDKGSYFKLDAAQEWIQQRLNGQFASPNLKDRLSTLQQSIIAARDTSNNLFQVCDESLKSIQDLSSDFHANIDKIRYEVDKVKWTKNESDLIRKTQLVMDEARDIQDKPY